MSKVMVMGKSFALAEKQPKLKANIVGRTFVLPTGKIDPEKENLWEARQYGRIDKMAAKRAEETGLPQHIQLIKSGWYVSYNGPECIVMDVTKIDDNLLGLMKHNQMYNTSIALHDHFSGIRRILPPVCDLRKVPMFQKMKIEEIENPDEKAAKGLAILHEGRRLYKEQKVWPLMNEAMFDINEFYKQDKIESRFERIIWATRYAAQDTLKAIGASITIYDLDAPEFLAQFIAELSVWARPFGIDLKLSTSEFTSDTFKPSHWFKHKTGYEYSRFKEVQYSLRTILGARTSSYSELVLAYNQIQFYKENGISDFLAPDYTLCPCCNLPLSIYAEECESCGTANPVYDEVRLSYVPGTILK